MTLIAVLANRDQTVMLADRRLTSDNPPGNPVNEEYNKLTSFVCKDARLGVAFTGRATTLEGFSTSDWLVNALIEAGEPSPFLQPTIEQLRAIAIRDINKLPGKNLLTIALAGYHYSDAGPRGCVFWISNFEGAQWSQTSTTPRPVFDLYGDIQDPSASQSFHAVKAFGATRLLSNPESIKDGEVITRLLIERKPLYVIRDKGLEALNRVGAHEGRRGLVGKQCGSIVVPSDPSQPFMVDYYSQKNKWEVELPNQVDVTGTGVSLWNIALGVGGFPQSSPMVVKRAPRNDPCPCRSGRKYKRCHGRPNPPSQIMMGGTFTDV